MEILSVTETIAQYLKEQIIANRIKSGKKLNEIELADELNTSRGPLREAFRMLENENLLVKIPRKGTYVTELSVERLREVYTARKMIELYAIDLFKSEKVRQFPKIYDSINNVTELSLPSPDNIKETIIYLKSLTDFHVNLVASTHNPWFIKFYSAIDSTLARYAFFCIQGADRTVIAAKDHKQIFELLTSGSYDETKEMLIAHIDGAIRNVEKYVKENETWK